MCQDCDFRSGLFAHGLLIETGVEGLYGRSGEFEDVVNRFDALITSFGGGDNPEVVRFPPGMNRAGTIHAFNGNDRDHAALLDKLAAGEDWTLGQEATDVVLAPAACYPLYPTVAKRGPLPDNGRLYDLQSYCFRREPSREMTRMQMFRMREYVRIGTPEQVTEFRQLWLDRGRELISLLGVPFDVDVANDPFFGRAGRMLANNQRDQKLKFELLIPVESVEKPTACLSFNYHQDHFGGLWGIQTSTGEVAHTACVGFGMERVALALFKHHGFDTKEWPAPVRKALWG